MAANRLLACRSKKFSWGIEQEIVSANPCLGIKKNSEKPRERVLTEKDFRRLWQGLDEASGMSHGLRVALKLILVTAQRPGEIAGMRRSEIEGDWWTLPGVRAKNGKPHRVPLTSLAKELLASVGSEDDEVFPASRGPEGTLLVSSLAHAIREAEFVGPQPWTPHDLRRTAATCIASVGVQPHIIDRLLNPTDPSVHARHYDQYVYDAEKASAVNRWEATLRKSAGI